MSREEAIGAGYAARESSFNWRFFAHILKDVVDPRSPLIYYGDDYDLVPVLRDPEFGVESWHLYYGEGDSPYEHSFSWLPEINDSYFGHDYCDTFVSVNYAHPINFGSPEQLSHQIYELMKRGGVIVLVNPAFWASGLFDVFSRNYHAEDLFRSYAMLAHEEVVVFEK
jgi:hypothetical protein